MSIILNSRTEFLFFLFQSTGHAVFFSQFFNWKKGISYSFSIWWNPSEEEDKRKCWGGAWAWSRQPSWLSRISGTSPLSFPSIQQPPPPTPLLAPTFLLEKLHFNNYSFSTQGLRPSPTPGSPGSYQGLSLPDINRATQDLSCTASPALCKLFGVEQHDVHPTANIKLFFHHYPRTISYLSFTPQNFYLIYFPVSHSKYGLLKIF